MPESHTVKSFDEALKRLNQAIARMGGLAEAELAACIEALRRRDAALAERVVESDSQVDDMEREIDEQAIQLLALRQPMAGDLRTVVGSLRIAGDLERIADYAKNVAKRVVALTQLVPVEPALMIPRMGGFVREMLKDVLDAFADRDVAKAQAVWARDAELDAMHSSLFRELLTYMMEDPRNITPCIHLLFVAKNLERAGDHCTNIAEMVHYFVTGRPLAEMRRKGDEASFIVAGADRAEPR
jgi:phosphate transport system protein